MACSTIPALPIALPGDTPACCTTTPPPPACCDPALYVGKSMFLAFMEGTDAHKDTFTVSLPWTGGSFSALVDVTRMLGNGPGCPKPYAWDFVEPTLVSANIICTMVLGVPVYDLWINSINYGVIFRARASAPNCGHLSPDGPICTVCSAAYAASCFAAAISYNKCVTICAGGIYIDAEFTTISAIIS